jgi:DNA-binding transcriptional regulator YhcF (GntR family)
VKRVQYQLDLDSTEPIYQQLSTQIMEKIRRGTLPRGSKLPTVRDFAEELGLARGTIKRAYDENVLFVYKDKAKLLVSTLNGSEAAVLGASALGWE